MPASAAAQQDREDDRLQLYGSVGAGMLFSEDQRDYLDFDGPGGGFALGLGYPLWARGALSLLLEARAGLLLFQSTLDEIGSLGELGTGVRLDYRTPWRALFLGPAAHLMVAQTGRETRPSLALGLRATVRVSEQLAIGPALSYGRVVDFGARATTDAEYWLLSITLLRRHDPAPPGAPRPRGAPRERPPLRWARRIPPPPPPEPPPESPPESPPTELSIELSSLLDDAVTTRHEVMLVPPVLFVTDRAEPIACGEAALHFALEALRKVPGTVEVQGHADTRGEDAYNSELSLARARYVRDWLIDHGEDPARLQLSAHGERRNLVTEASGEDDERQLNRRVTFHLVREATGGEAQAPVPDAAPHPDVHAAPPSSATPEADADPTMP